MTPRSRLSQRGLADAPAEAAGPAESAACQHGPRTGLCTGLVTTPFDYACRILADPLAQRATGRGGRVLSQAEEAVFYEDLKTCGLKRRRLRELWAFLQCGLANLGDSDPDWIQTTEEQAVLDLARSILIFEEAVLPGEAVNLAVRALEAEPALRQRFGSPVVLADDYLLMSRASQRLGEPARHRQDRRGRQRRRPLCPPSSPTPVPRASRNSKRPTRPLQRVTLESALPSPLTAPGRRHPTWPARWASSLAPLPRSWPAAHDPTRHRRRGHQPHLARQPAAGARLRGHSGSSAGPSGLQGSQRATSPPPATTSASTF